MQKVLRTAAMVVTALSIIGLSGTSAFAATDQTVTDPADAAATTTETTTGGGDATNEACNTTVVIINNGDEPAQGTTGTQTGNDCPPAATPVTPAEPEAPGMGAGTPETPVAPVTPTAPVAMTLPNTGSDALGNVASTVMTLITAAGGMFVAAYRTVRG